VQEPDHCNIDVHIQHEYGGDELDHNAEWSNAIQYQLLQLCILRYEEVHAIVRRGHSKHDTDSIQSLLVGVHSRNIAVGVSCKCVYSYIQCTLAMDTLTVGDLNFYRNSNQLEPRLVISIAIVWHKVSLLTESWSRVLRYHTTNELTIESNCIPCSIGSD
jgi:hypothetical protein